MGVGLLVTFIPLASALRISVVGLNDVGISVMRTSPAAMRGSPIRCVDEPEDETERERLARLGREVAAEQARLDGAGAAEGDSLMAEFNKRLEAEGGATQFKIKTDAKAAAEKVQAGAEKVQGIGLDLADSASSAVSRLPPNLLPIIGVCVLLSVLPSIVGALFSGGGSGGYTV